MTQPPETQGLGHETNKRLGRGGTKSRNGEMRNEKLEMIKWKWSSLLLVDDISGMIVTSSIQSPTNLKLLDHPTAIN